MYNIELGKNIARNAALSENVFMMAVCTELRIPLFVVGKPGSSKSLAKDVISTHMKGDDSKNDLLKNLKQVRKTCPFSVKYKKAYINKTNTATKKVFLDWLMTSV